MTSGKIEVGTHALNCRVDGEPGNPWLILSNSLATDHEMWQPQIDALTRTHRVLRYDTRGHGASAAPPGPYEFDHLVADVIALMDAHEIEKATFMGLSLGGMTALGLALDHPDRIERIICCDARADAPDIYKKMWPAMIGKAREEGMDALVGPTLERWFSEHFRSNPASRAALEATRDMIRRTAVEGYAGCASALMRLDYLPRLPQISVPAHFIVGEHDPAAPLPVMREMAEATPGADFTVIPGAAHLSNVERPDVFNDVVTTWLARA
ncbi:3-oxoadipate enol-lactonase [Nitratireductor sp. XY-223]|uniref:3-oxoadipate enol-lactonase n=1 Tax=Nitratireductor sp. XY-223 TaxID=2561926 RepID=UPI0010AA8482|nr:3-oxoadipate enol-lactonase [Nitratireductor sp. XY-223]